MTFVKFARAIATTHGLAVLLLSSNFVSAQNQTSVGSLTVSVILNGFVSSIAAPSPVAGACITKTLFNELGAVIRVTCVDNPFVVITPSIESQLPGTFGSTFRYPLFSNPGSFNLASAGFSNFNTLSGSLNSAGASSRSGDSNTQTTLGTQMPSGGDVLNRNFDSPTSTVTDMSIYRTAPQATTDEQGAMDMVISF